MATFIASQRTDYDLPHATSCRVLGVSPSWFYKWHQRGPTPREQRRAELDAAVKRCFDASDGNNGSPRILLDLRDKGWRVSKKSVEASMVRQGLAARPAKRRRRSLTRPEKKAVPAPDLIQRDFSASAINERCCGDLTEIPTGEGKLYLAFVEDLASRRVPGFSLSERHDAKLATAALQMAVAVRGGDVSGVIFHSDRGSEYTAELFAAACERLGVTQSMGRVGSCFDNAAAESFGSTLEFELLRRHRLSTKADARREVAAFIDRYNRIRRHSWCQGRSPVDYEQLLAARSTTQDIAA